jgi:hypothetical protein
MMKVAEDRPPREKEGEPLQSVSAAQLGISTLLTTWITPFD